MLNRHATCTHTDMRSNVYEDAAICFWESQIRITQSFQRILHSRVQCQGQACLLHAKCYVSQCRRITSERAYVCVSTCRMVIEHMYQRFFLRFLILHRTFTIPIKSFTKHVKPLHSLLCVCVYVYVYVCLSVCVYLYLHEQGRRTKVHMLCRQDNFSSSFIMFFKPFSCPLLSSVCLYIANIHVN